MAKVGLLHLSNKIWALTLGLLVLVACATHAPELPSDYGSVHTKQRLSIDDFDPKTAQLTCVEIKQELIKLNSIRAAQSHDIAQKRGSNQTIGYIGSMFFLPLVLATDSSVQTKEKISNIHKAKDKLYKLQAFKKCPSEKG